MELEHELRALKRSDICNIIACIVFFIIDCWKVCKYVQKLEDITFIVLSVRQIFYNEEIKSMLESISYIQSNMPDNVQHIFSKWKGPLQYNFKQLHNTFTSHPTIAHKYDYLKIFF